MTGRFGSALLVVLTASAVASAVTYQGSLVVVRSMDPPGTPVRVRGMVELRGVSPIQAEETINSVRVVALRAGRNEKGILGAADNSRDVAVPRKDGSFELAVTVEPGVPRDLWLIEARAPGYETGAVVVASGATLEFVLVPRAPVAH